MPRRRLAALGMVSWVAGSLGSLGSRAHAQAAPRRIVLLTLFSRADGERLLAFLRSELQKLGWVDGQDLRLELRSTEGNSGLLPAAAAEIVAQAPDLLLAQTVPATRALMQATRTIPILMVSVGNPVDHGLVADYRKPGGNVTGTMYPAEESVRKLLQLLTEALPSLRSVALLVNPSNDATASLMRAAREAAAGLGLQLQIVPVAAQGDFEAAFAAVRSAKAQALVLPPEPLILSQREAIADFTQAQRMPVAAISAVRSAPANWLMLFTASLVELTLITVRQVDRVLKGAKPTEMPIEQPTRFDLRLNLRNARALGITLPQSLLLRADEVIE